MLVRDEGGGGEGVDNFAEQVRDRWTKSICRRSLKCHNYLKEGLSKRMRLIKEKDLPDFETGHTENLRLAVTVRWVMKVSISLSFCFTLLVIIQKNQNFVIFFRIY